MATSGSKSVTVKTGLTLKFSWSQKSQDVSNNKTTISWTLQVILSSGYSISSSANKSWEVTVNGTKYSGSTTLPSSGTKTMGSGETTIAHNSDGTKTFSYSFSQTFGITFNGASVTSGSGSGSGTLDTIARASSVSGGSGNIGSSTTITISRASSSFTHTLTYTFGSLSGTIATKTASTSVSWTIPTSFYAQVTTAKSKTGTIKCETFNGSTSIGSKSISFTATVTGSEPTLSPKAEVASDSVTASLTGSTTKFIKNYTTVTVSTGASAKNSATIKSQSIVNGSTTINSGSGTIPNIQNGTFSFSVTDSRGYTKTSTLTRTIVDYVQPTIAWSYASIDTDGKLTLGVNGKCFNGSFGSVTNTIKVQWQYKASGGSWSGWKDMTITRNGNSYTATASATGYDTKKTYIVKAWIGDKFYDLGQNSGVYTAEKSAKCLPVFDWGENDFNFNVSYVAINGNDKTLKMGTGSSDVYIYNSKCNKYLQLMDNGLVKWSGNTLYGDHYKQYGTYSLHGEKPNAKIGYYTDDSCVYISNNNNNWLRICDNGDLTWRGYDIVLSGNGINSNSIIVKRGGNNFIARPAAEGNAAYYVFQNSSGTRTGFVGTPNANYNMHIMSETGMVILRGSVVACKTADDSAYSECKASKFTQSSEAKWKENIEPLGKSAMDMINSATVYEYNFINEPNQKQIGLVIDEGVPQEIVVQSIGGQDLEIDENTPMMLSLDDEVEVDKGIDLYAMTSLSWKALQEKDKEIQKLKQQNDELEERIAKLEEQLGVE